MNSHEHLARDERERSQLDAAEKRPLTEQAREALLRAIRSDAFPDGRLPPESELAVQLGVSRTTLRAALQSLAADGLISRRRRHGTFVNAHLLRASMRLNRLVPFTTLIAQCGHTPSVDPQTHAVAVAPQFAVDALKLERGEPCLVVERLLRAGGEPVIVVIDVVALAALSVAPEEVVEADTTFGFLAANGAGSVDYTTAEIIPRVARADDAPAGLQIAAGEPYIELLETSFSRDHERLAVSRVSVDDRLVRFSLLRREL